MSRAARETGRARRGDELPLLSGADLAVVERAPDPPQGAFRDALAEQAATRIAAKQDALSGVAEQWANRVTGVVLSRLKGPRARRDTRYWTPSEKSAPAAVETKAVDDAYVVPGRLASEITDAARPVVERIVSDSVGDVRSRVGGGVVTGFEVDNELLADLIDEALEDMLGDASNMIDSLREAIVEGDSRGVELDELIDLVESAGRKGGNWMRLSARTLATATTAKAEIEQARALGVTHMQWLSRRDERVRLTHRIADGQVRQLGDKFVVGRHHLEFPGDPTGLPETASEVHGCRCALLFADADDEFLAALQDIAVSAMGSDNAAPAIFSQAMTADLYTAAPPGLGLPQLASMITLPSPVVGWRQLAEPLAASPGQSVVLPAQTVLGLAAPATLSTAAMAVRLPAGLGVGVSGGALVLVEPVTAEIVGVGGSGVQAAVLS